MAKERPVRDGWDKHKVVRVLLLTIVVLIFLFLSVGLPALFPSDNPKHDFCAVTCRE
jgi:hypothetical protein